MTPDTIKALADAYEAGALAVHDEWVAAHCNGEEPPRGDPDFSEAANDYARSIPTDPLASDRVEAVQQEAVAVAQGLEEIAGHIEMWLDWHTKHRDREPITLTTDDGTSIMALPVPMWPSHGQFKAWIKLFRDAKAILAAPVHPRIDGERIVQKETPLAMRDKG